MLGFPSGSNFKKIKDFSIEHLRKSLVMTNFQTEIAVSDHGTVLAQVTDIATLEDHNERTNQ